MINVLIVCDKGQIIDSIKHDLDCTYDDVKYTEAESYAFGIFDLSYSIDLIIVDADMVNDRIENFVSKVRKGAIHSKDTPIIIMGMEEKEEVFKKLILEYNEISYVFKGFDIEELRSALVDVRLL